jgi:hypothetical protein
MIAGVDSWTRGSINLLFAMASLLSAVDPWQAANQTPPVSLQTILQLTGRSDYSPVAATLTGGKDP